MTAIVTRVSSASVDIEGQRVSAIGRGLLVLVGVAEGDTQSEATYVASKVANLRVFDDDEGKMNRSVADIGGEVLVVSQFTLLGDVRRGRRPSFIRAAKPDEARRLYEAVAAGVRAEGVPVSTGVFQADMQVTSVNDGPVTILIETGALS